MSKEYDEELCKEIHKRIDEKFIGMEKGMDKVSTKLSWLCGIAFTILITIIGSLLTK